MYQSKKRISGYCSIPLYAATAALALGAAGAAQAANSEANKSDTTNVSLQTIPSAATISIDDQQMAAAQQDKQDWLLHGRSYTNQRYSPLDQINARNIDSLTPAALVQTGMVASFETTPLVIDGVMYATTPMVDDKMKIMALNAATGERYLGRPHTTSAPTRPAAVR